MKVKFLALFLLIISTGQAISNEDFNKDFTSEDKSLIHSNEKAHEILGNLNGKGNIENFTRLNHKNVIVSSENEHKHGQYVVTIRKLAGGFGGGGRGGGGFGGGGRGGGFGGGGFGGGGKGGGGFGGGGKGGGGFGGGGKGGGGGGGRTGRGGSSGVGAGIIGGAAAGGIFGGIVANQGGHNHSNNSATTLSAPKTHFCVLTFILWLSFWL